ncbi:MAG: PqqD family protein [Solirubrobacteraceae bacterium]
MQLPQAVVNARHVVHETIDGETILIHLGTGVYYSLDGTGAEIWALASQGVPAADLVGWLEARHPEQAALVEGAVAALFAELLAEELLVEGVPEQLPELPADASPGAFTPPALQKYTDMQQFMLVDPLHEVDEQAGWPNVASG